MASHFPLSECLIPTLKTFLTLAPGKQHTMESCYQLFHHKQNFATDILRSTMHSDKFTFLCVCEDFIEPLQICYRKYSDGMHGWYSNRSAPDITQPSPSITSLPFPFRQSIFTVHCVKKAGIIVHHPSLFPFSLPVSTGV